MGTKFDPFLKRLSEEKLALQAELTSINKPTTLEDGDETEFRDETADRFEEIEDRRAASTTLELRLKEVSAAIDRLENNSYGYCSVCGTKIENDRLEANPAANTCKKHLI